METQALSLPIHLPSLFLHFWSLSKAPALSPLASFIIFISTHSCIYFSFCLSCPFPGCPRFSQRGFKLQISLHTALTTYHLNVFCVSSPDSGIWSPPCTDRPSATDSDLQQTHLFCGSDKSVPSESFSLAPIPLLTSLFLFPFPQCLCWYWPAWAHASRPSLVPTQVHPFSLYGKISF